MLRVKLGDKLFLILPAPPRFPEEIQLTPAERGIAYHTALQHLQLTEPLNEKTIREQLKICFPQGIWIAGNMMQLILS